MNIIYGLIIGCLAMLGGQYTPAGPVFPTGTAQFFDDFTGTAGTALNTYNSNWGDLDTTHAPASQFQLAATNGFTLVNASGEAGAMYTPSSSDTSQIITDSVSGSAVDKEVCVRNTLGQKGYCYTYFSFSGSTATGVGLIKFGGNSMTPTQVNITINSASVNFSTSHLMAIVAVTAGPNVGLTGYLDGVSVITGTDSSSTIASGHPGFYELGAGTAADNKFGTGSTTPTPAHKWCDYLC